MMQLRYVAIAIALLAGCRKEPRPAPTSGSAVAAADASTAPVPPDTAPATADAAPAPVPPDAAGAVDAAPAPADAGVRPDASGPDPGAPGQGEPCSPAGKCQTGLTCVEYFGFAGPRGPKFTSCEIRCGDGGKCPARQSCVTIADGPGQVCRP
ncbi:MAG TPA: hypothetical protein VNO30_12840 [Kofleriaceae bacterium]|nr:hypothetical protein [Kofleriaceae bacterium]